MIIFLVTSVFATSFAPFTMNVDSIALTVNNPSLSTTAYQLDFTIESDSPVGSTPSVFYLVGYPSKENKTEVFRQLIDKGDLNGQPNTVGVKLDALAYFRDLKTIFVDAIEKNGATETSIIAGGNPVQVNFAKVTGVTSQIDGTSVKFTFTLDKDLGSVNFICCGSTQSATKVGTDGHVYTVTVGNDDLLRAKFLYGYFKGTTVGTSTLPVSLFTPTPAMTLKYFDSSYVKGTLSPPEGMKVWLQRYYCSSPSQLTKDKDEKYTINYRDLHPGYGDDVAGYIYYTNAAGILQSNRQDISLPDFPYFRYQWMISTDPDDKTPSLKITFREIGPNRKLLIGNASLAQAISLSSLEYTLQPAQLVCDISPYFIVVDESGVPATQPKTLYSPWYETSKGAVDDDGIIPVTVRLSSSFFFWKAKPTGLLVHREDETDLTKAKYYPFTWSINQETANEATAEVPAEDWPQQNDHNIVSYVVGNYLAGPPPTATKVSNKFYFVPAPIKSPVVTVGTPTFNTSSFKLSLPFSSDKDFSTDTLSEFKVVIYSGEYNTIFSTDVKAMLNAESQTIVVDFVRVSEPSYQKDLRISVDFIQKPRSASQFSVIEGQTRKEVVTFGAFKESVSYSSGATFTFFIALETDLALPEGAKLVLGTSEYEVAKDSSKVRTYKVDIPNADLIAAPPTKVYIRGDTAEKSVFPFDLLSGLPYPPDLYFEYIDGENTRGHIEEPKSETDKIYLKVGDKAARAITKATGKDYYELKFAELTGTVLLYVTNKDDILITNTRDVSLSTFVPPEKVEWRVVPAQQGENTEQKIAVRFTYGPRAERPVLCIHKGETIAPIVFTDYVSEFEPDLLVGTSANYIIGYEYDDFLVTESHPLAFGKASFTQTAGAEKDKKIPVTVTIVPGFFEAVPAGILVRAAGETDFTNAKYYTITWSEETVNTGTADVSVEDWKGITDKDIESYVAPDYSGGIPATPVKLSEKYALIKGSSAGGFARIASLMAVLGSLLVLAF